MRRRASRTEWETVERDTARILSPDPARPGDGSFRLLEPLRRRASRKVTTKRGVTKLMPTLVPSSGSEGIFVATLIFTDSTAMAKLDPAVRGILTTPIDVRVVLVAAS
jgi:hypothetical protein